MAKVNERGDERDDGLKRINVRRIRDRTFIGGTPLYSRFQRGGRECGYKDVGLACNEVEGLVWQVMAASRLITAVRKAFGPGSIFSPCDRRAFRVFPTVISAPVRIRLAGERSVNASAGRGSCV